MTKPIYAAIAAPGAGKTESLIIQLTEYIKSGEKVVIALPTLDLSKDILCRMKVHGVTPKVINSNDYPGKTTHVINGTLRNGSESVIIITHEGLRLSNPSLLRSHILVIDEVPDVFELQHITNLTSTEANQITSVTEKVDGKLIIKPGMKTKIGNRVKTYQMSEKNKSVTSTLSKSEFRIFKTILNHGIVHTEILNNNNSDDTTYNFYTIENKDIFKHIEKAKETHILAANIEGGIFHLFAKKKGYQFERSRFTPSHYKYNCDITIYPMLNEPWSKRKVLMDETGKTYEYHLGQNTQLIDKIFSTAISNTPNEKFIVVQNSWGKFEKEYTNQKKAPAIEFLNIDCRGLNTQKDKTAAVLLFTGNPSPNDKKSFRVLASEHEVHFNDLERAWTVTKKLETALQAVTRTAIRIRENTTPVHFYIQDLEVAEYLKNTYMPDARIDNSLALAAPKKQDKRSHLTQNEKKEALNFIRHEIDRGIKRSKIIKTVIGTWKYSDSHARRIVKEVSDLVRTFNPVQEELGNLTQFFASC